MQTIFKIFTLIAVAGVLVLLINLAGESVLAGNRLMALIPVAIVLAGILVYVRLAEKKK